MSEDDLPGVALRMVKASASSVGTSISVQVELTGVIRDWDLWENVSKKLQTEGLKIYSVDDFKTELLNALREEVKTLERRMKNREQEIAELRHQNQVLRTAVGSNQNSG